MDLPQSSSDPMIGWLSDRTRSRWGRRYPWMMMGAIPLGIVLLYCGGFPLPPARRDYLSITL